MRDLDRKGAQTEPRLWPLAMVCLDKALMCLGWCLLRQDFRRFHPDRMQEVAVTGASFRPRRVPLLRDHVAKIREAFPNAVRA